MKNISIILFILILFSCAQPTDMITSAIVQADNPEIPEPIIPDDPGQPIIENEDEAITEEKMIIAYLNYDGKLFEYDDKDVLTKTREGENIVRIGNVFFDENDMNPAPLKGGVYDEIIIYQGIDGNIYACDKLSEISTLLFNNYRNEKALFPVDGDGMVLNYRFIKPDGSVENASFIGVDYGQVYRVEEINGVYNKSIRKLVDDIWQWIDVGSSNFALTIEHGQVNCDGIIHHSMSAILENDSLKEPSYDINLRKYIGGNDFIKYIQPGIPRRIMTGLGYVDGTAYFFCAMDGKIYKYDLKNNLVSEWIEITAGTGNNDKVESYALIDATAAILTNGYIIYWSAGTIYKLNIETGEKSEIAESTDLKAWGN